MHGSQAQRVRLMPRAGSAVTPPSRQNVSTASTWNGEASPSRSKLRSSGDGTAPVPFHSQVWIADRSPGVRGTSCGAAAGCAGFGIFRTRAWNDDIVPGALPPFLRIRSSVSHSVCPAGACTCKLTQTVYDCVHVPDGAARQADGAEYMNCVSMHEMRQVCVTGFVARTPGKHTSMPILPRDSETAVSLSSAYGSVSFSKYTWLTLSTSATAGSTVFGSPCKTIKRPCRFRKLTSRFCRLCRRNLILAVPTLPELMNHGSKQKTVYRASALSLAACRASLSCSLSPCTETQ